MSDLLAPKDYLILFRLNVKSGDDLCRILNDNGAPNMTVCPECRVDDFMHMASCKIGKKRKTFK